MDSTGEPSLDFAAVYRAHFQGLRGLVRHFGVPAREADDVAQEALVGVWRALGRYDPGRPLKPWLRAITYRTARDYLAKQRWWEAAMRQPAEEHDLAASAPTPDELLGAWQRQRVLSEIVQGLGPIFAMAEMDGLFKWEIGEALGLKVSTVRSRLRKARSEFAAAVSRYQARAAAGRRGPGPRFGAATEEGRERGALHSWPAARPEASGRARLQGNAPSGGVGTRHRRRLAR